MEEVQSYTVNVSRPPVSTSPVDPMHYRKKTPQIAKPPSEYKGSKYDQLPMCNVIRKPCTAHVWDKYKGPIPLVAFTTPRYYYECVNCQAQLCSEIKIPRAALRAARGEECAHELVPALALGPNYEAYTCKKCDYQECKFIKSTLS